MMYRSKRKKKSFILLYLLVLICLAVVGFWFFFIHGQKPARRTEELGKIEGYENLNIHEEVEAQEGSFDVPPFSGEPFYIIQDKPSITEDEKEGAKESYIHLSDLDSLKRCGVVYASLSLDTLPEDDRESIGMVKPSGWHTARYDDLVEDKYLYNRCHLIAHCLSGLNAEEKNLVTGTRYMNVSGMLPFEVETVRYIEKTGNHVFYRVTPIFEGEDLVCRGVRMEAYSIEDNGKLAFDVFCYNVQPGIVIDYRTGDSKRE